MANPQQELAVALQQLYQSREYADLMVFAKDDSCYHAHRALVCTRSSYFSEAVSQGRWIEGKQGQLSLSDEDPETVRMLMDYFYLLDYQSPFAFSASTGSRTHSDDAIHLSTGGGDHGNMDDSPIASTLSGPSHFSFDTSSSARVKSRTFPSESDLTIHAIPGYGFESISLPGSRSEQRIGRTSTPLPSPWATENPDLVLHAKMYAAGVTYGVKGLKALALDRFKLQLTRHWNSPEFAEAIYVVYNSTPSSDRDMRDTVVDTLASDCHKSLLSKANIEAVVCGINGLAFELLKRTQRVEPEYMR